MRKLKEGMRAGDLEDLLLPLVSVDEYESKIDDTAIVIGFFVHERDAAEDLNRFIQRSPVEILDCEISPAPDMQGFYMVFVEFLGNSQFARNVTDLLGEVAGLANIEEWKMQARGQDGLTPFTTESLEKAVASQNSGNRQEHLGVTVREAIDRVQERLGPATQRPVAEAAFRALVAKGHATIVNDQIYLREGYSTETLRSFVLRYVLRSQDKSR